MASALPNAYRDGGDLHFGTPLVFGLLRLEDPSEVRGPLPHYVALVLPSQRILHLEGELRQRERQHRAAVWIRHARTAFGRVEEGQDRAGSTFRGDILGAL